MRLLAIKGSLCLDERLSRYTENPWDVATYFYAHCSNTQLMFTHIHFVDLLSCPLKSSPDSPSDEGAALFGVAEVLAITDL